MSETFTPSMLIHYGQVQAERDSLQEVVAAHMRENANLRARVAELEAALAKRDAAAVAVAVYCPECGWKGSTTSELHDDVEGDLLCPRAGCTGVLAASQQAAKGEGT